MIITREELMDEISSLPNIADQCLPLCIFEGICGKNYWELVTLNPENIEGNTILLKGKDSERKIEISYELIDLIRKSAIEYKYYQYTQNSDFSRLDYKSNDPSVFKEMQNAFSDSPVRKMQRIRNRMDRIYRYIGNPSLKTSVLLDSGRIEMIKKFMAEDNSHDAVATILKHKAEIEGKYLSKFSSVKGYVEKFQSYFS